jgi:capsular polysaccharide biosynthesis protein
MAARLKSLVPAPIRNRLRGFRWPASIVRFLPGNSGWFGPPRRWMRIREYFAGGLGSVREVIPAQALKRPNPEVVDPFPSRFLETSRDEVPPACIFTLRDAKVVGAEGWIVAPGDVFLIDASFEGNVAGKPASGHHIFRSRRGRPPARRVLPGRCLSIASDYAIGGFGHFVHDSLTRLCIVAEAGYSPADFDWVYAPRPDTPIVRELMAGLGIPPGRLLNFDASVDLFCEELTATSFPGVPGMIAPVYANYLRSHFAPAKERSDRRIYLSRNGYRRNFANLAEVEETLARHGFEEVRAHDDPQTLKKCAEAQYVFCIEGASFFNALFCSAGTSVLLVYPDRLPHSVPYALTLAEAAGFRTLVMGAETVGEPGVDGGIADVYLDPVRLVDALKRLISK